jgi:hypothetical protein
MTEDMMDEIVYTDSAVITEKELERILSEHFKNPNSHQKPNQ